MPTLKAPLIDGFILTHFPCTMHLLTHTFIDWHALNASDVSVGEHELVMEARQMSPSQKTRF